MSFLIWFILICVAWFFVHKFFKQFKLPKVGSMSLVSGGVKCGKSTFAVALAMKEYKRRRRSVKIRNFFRRCFGKKQKELPLLYSNIPLAVDYVPLSQDLLQRNTRFVYGSVIYVCEASLVADSSCIRDHDLNDNLLLFNKLIGHETKGGCVIYDTQSVSDCHYSIKRCLSEYFYIHHLTKWIPFFLIAHIQECRYSEDGTVVQAQTEDIENNLRKVIIKKSTWKKFDCYCYSVFTDNLPVEKKEVLANKKDLKVKNLVSFKQRFIDKLKGGLNK